MIIGAIKSVHVIIHPLIIIHVFGFFIYLRLLAKAFSPIKHTFLDIIIR